MKTALKYLAPVALLAAATSANAINVSPCAGGRSATSYYIDSVEKGAKVKITLQGAGAVTLPNAALTGDSPVGQDFMLNADCTFVSHIYTTSTEGRTDLYTITGSWFYPAESKLIYFTLDGDISKGAEVDPEATTWGRLFAGGLSIPNVMPLLFPAKVSAYNVTYPSVTVKTGTIQLSPDGQSAKATMSIIGKGVTTDTKSVRKETGFSFGSTVKATVVANPT